MACLKSFAISVFLFFVLQFKIVAQQANVLPRSTPENEGVSSKDIIKFLDATTKSKTEFHSFMLLRHGKVIAEAWWNPYKPDLRHSLYSCSKSFTATAIGFAVTEKKLSLDDKVISFFPNELPDTVSTYLKELTVKDVLMMSDGMEPDPTFTVARSDTNWTKGFLATKIVNEPGAEFLYNSLGTYMLSAILQKVTGETTLNYLKPRLFEPLGINGIDWETNMLGVNTGGWGLRVKTEDMAKFAELFLQKGKWNGKQVLSESWIDEASTMKIMQNPNAPQSKKDSSDWLQGYCYQMWRCRHNAYRGDGAYGQFMIVMPDQDAVLAITAETADMQEEINLVWDYLLPAFRANALPADASADKQLKDKIKLLALPVPSRRDEALSKNINGKTFTTSANNLHLKNIVFNFSNEKLDVAFTTNTSTYNIDFGDGKWQPGETNMPGPSLTSGSIENTSMLYPAKIRAAYTWKDATTLELTLRYIESPHTEIYTCNFNDKKLTISAARSLDFGKTKTVIEAETK